ncbi:MarR family winged helix-turn-helix transcriptional regulator [Hellea balneolensis]|uniref:MarR family winged helix-turn-helix transcriptional regulator n=1 Tax=Hellea balneolensis TaxID=287478 RepID=UPI00047960D3|nr:MarR family winged helix-turn-helix transcriptional regulator [Hellea balneolensis]
MTMDFNVNADTTKASFLDYQIRSLYLETERKLPCLLDDSGCNLSEFYILRAHWDKGSLSFTELSAHADLSDESATKAIASLIQKGLLADIKGKGINPLSSFKLTPLGSKTRQNTMAKYDRFIAELYAGLSEQDIEHALRVMMTLHQNLQLDSVQTGENSTVTSIF